MAHDMAKGQGYKPLTQDSIALEEVSKLVISMFSKTDKFRLFSV